MAGKLDQSLDEILKGQRPARRTNPRRAATTRGNRPSAAPAGGIQKTAKTARNAVKPGPAKAANNNAPSKIMVSNLPKDVTEVQIKEYFGKAVSKVKHVDLAYDANRQSRGVAHITFAHKDAAAKAFADLNGIVVDGKTVKVEMIVDKPEVILAPAPKSLAQRITAKPQPKSAAVTKHANSAKAGNAGAKAKGNKATGRKGRISRPKKTAAELDAEMQDYFAAAPGQGASGAAAPATATAEVAMDDEIL